MHRWSLLFALVFAVLSPVIAADPPQDGLRSARAKQLLGRWQGGPCQGVIEFRGDGTFERWNYGPGACHLSGTWELQAADLPPKLILNCTAADVKELLTTTSLKLQQVTAQRLVFGYDHDNVTSEYERISAK